MCEQVKKNCEQIKTLKIKIKKENQNVQSIDT